jgi:hypothetical protein
MEQLRIHTKLNSQYQVFDASGQLPFSIIFGLCRRSPADTDARPLILHTANSALDIPYALSHGLLTLYEQRTRGEQEVHIDLSGQLKSSDGEGGSYLILSSPVNRTENKWEAFTVYQYRIEPHSELASVLQPGRKYTIQLASKDLGVGWWAYDDGSGHQLLDNRMLKTRQASETAKLVNSKSSAGKASFAVVAALPFPPKVEIRMRLCQNEETTGGADGACYLEVSVFSMGIRPVVVQTRGRQLFLVPWGPFQPEDMGDSHHPRVVNNGQITPSSNLKVIDAATDEVMSEPRKPGPCGPLTDSSIDLRPKLEALVTLKSDVPLIRRVDISGLLSGLPDGKYRVLMVPWGVWWCFGCCEEITDEGDDRVPQRLHNTRVPPLMLETKDVVKLQIEDGKVLKEPWAS